MGRVLIACASADAAMAARVSRTLVEAGHDVETRQKAPSLKPEKDAFDAAGNVVLLWSRHMTGEAAMLREAAAAGKRLVVVRLDATRPPLPLRGARVVALSAARPQEGLKALQDLGAAAPQKSTPKPRRAKMNPSPTLDAVGGRDERSTWRGTLLITLLVGAIAWSAYYVVVGKPVDFQRVIAALPV